MECGNGPGGRTAGSEAGRGKPGRKNGRIRMAGSARRMFKLVGRVCRWLPEFLSAAGILAILGTGLWSYYFETPCRVEQDCRGRGIDVSQVKAWEEQERDSYNGIIGIAGWRIETMQPVISVSTGRQKVSEIIGFYGEASLVYPAGLLSGDLSSMAASGDASSADAAFRAAAGDTPPAGAAVRAGAVWDEAAGNRTAEIVSDFCILTGELSDALFGSTDTAGELVKIGDEILAVAGVIDKEGVYLLRPVSDGRVEYAAFRLSCRYQAEAKAGQRVSGS